MPNEVVRRTEKLLLGKAAYLYKEMICEGDAAARIGARDQGLAVRNFDLVIGNRFVDAHGPLLKPAGKTSILPAGL
ncbi:MAG: hypothetical protein AB7S57_01050 [Acetobacteraceae bacterium]